MSTLEQLFPLRKLFGRRTTPVKYPRGIIFIGDSITAHPTASYPALLKKMYPQLKIDVLAKSGSTTEWMKKNLPLVAVKKYSRAYIYAGINDAFGTKPITEALNNVQSMINTLRTYGTEVYVILGYEPSNFMDYRKMPTTRWVKKKTDYIPLVARYVQLQNLYATKLTNAVLVNKIVLKPEMTLDGTHPLGTGQTAIANAISLTL